MNRRNRHAFQESPTQYIRYALFAILCITSSLSWAADSNDNEPILLLDCLPSEVRGVEALIHKLSYAGWKYADRNSGEIIGHGGRGCLTLVTKQPQPGTDDLTVGESSTNKCFRIQNSRSIDKIRAALGDDADKYSFESFCSDRVLVIAEKNDPLLSLSLKSERKTLEFTGIRSVMDWLEATVTENTDDIHLRGGVFWVWGNPEHYKPLWENEWKFVPPACSFTVQEFLVHILNTSSVPLIMNITKTPESSPLSTSTRGTETAVAHRRTTRYMIPCEPGASFRGWIRSATPQVAG